MPHVQSKAGTSNSFDNSQAITLDGAVGAGNVLCGTVCWGNATPGDLLSITDNIGGNTYVIRDATADSSNGQSAASFYALDVQGGPTVITANFQNSPGYQGITVSEFDDPVDAFDNSQGRLQASPGTGTDGASSGASTQTPSVNNCLVYGGCAMTGNIASGANEYTQGTGFTEPAAAETHVSGELALSGEYQIQTTATAVNASFTVAQNVAHITFQIILKPTASVIDVTDVSPSSFNDAQTGVVITGTVFGASQGTGDVVLSPTDDIGDAGAVDQTVTSWADTSITFTVVKGGLSYGEVFLFVRNDDTDSNAAGFSCQLVEPWPSGGASDRTLRTTSSALRW